MKSWKVTVVDGVPCNSNNPWPQVPTFEAECEEDAAEAAAAWAKAEVKGLPEYSDGDMFTVRVFDDRGYIIHRMVVECP